MQFHVRLRDRRLERIQIHNDQINGFDGVCFHRRLVRRVAANVKQPTVNERMQRFHAAVEHFRKTRVFGNIFHRQARVTQRLGGAAGGNQFHTRRRQRLGESHETGLVRNRK